MSDPDQIETYNRVLRPAPPGPTARHRAGPLKTAAHCLHKTAAHCLHKTAAHCLHKTAAEAAGKIIYGKPAERQDLYDYHRPNVI